MIKSLTSVFKHFFNLKKGTVSASEKRFGIENKYRKLWNLNRETSKNLCETSLVVVVDRTFRH